VRPIRRSGDPGLTPFERWGGDPFFVALVERFYQGVATDPLLRPMYPEDLTDSKAHLALFLAQYWGGPERYNEERGAPRLRMRHAPFVIGSAASEAWLRHMTAAVDDADLGADDKELLLDYLAMAANSLINARP
jgi:hemoglobin